MVVADGQPVHHVLGSVVVGHGGGAYTMVMYFTSELKYEITPMADAVVGHEVRYPNLP